MNSVKWGVGVAVWLALWPTAAARAPVPAQTTLKDAYRNVFRIGVALNPALFTGSDARGAASAGAAASSWLGRGLPTWVAERMNLESADAGACGTTICWKQVGHSIRPPLVLESAVIC